MKNLLTYKLYFILIFLNIINHYLYLNRLVTVSKIILLRSEKIWEVKQKLKWTHKKDKFKHVKLKGIKNSHGYFFPLSINFRKDVSFYKY